MLIQGKDCFCPGISCQQKQEIDKNSKKMSKKFEIKNINYSILILKEILVTQKAIKDFKVL